MIRTKQGDCLELIKEIPNESIDLIVTDPPYLMEYKSCHRKNKSHKFCSEIKNDNNEEVIQKAIKECYRVLKNNSAMYMFCNSNKIDVFKTLIENQGFTIKNIIVWVKNNWTAGDLEAQFAKQYEFIILANKGRKVFNQDKKRITDVWKFNRVAGDLLVHQNQKPVDLIERCIEYHSKEQDKVLDMFMGSGTTAVACQNLNRNFIGYELDEEYFEIAKKRINSNSTQIKLF